MTTTYMGTGGVAEYLGLTTGSVKSYVAKGLLLHHDKISVLGGRGPPNLK